MSTTILFVALAFATTCCSPVAGCTTSSSEDTETPTDDCANHHSTTDPTVLSTASESDCPQITVTRKTDLSAVVEEKPDSASVSQGNHSLHSSSTEEPCETADEESRSPSFLAGLNSEKSSNFDSSEKSPTLVQTTAECSADSITCLDDSSSGSSVSGDAASEMGTLKEKSTALSAASPNLLKVITGESSYLLSTASPTSDQSTTKSLISTDRKAIMTITESAAITLSKQATVAREPFTTTTETPTLSKLQTTTATTHDVSTSTLQQLTTITETPTLSKPKTTIATTHDVSTSITQKVTITTTPQVTTTTTTDFIATTSMAATSTVHSQQVNTNSTEPGVVPTVSTSTSLPAVTSSTSTSLPAVTSSTSTSLPAVTSSTSTSLPAVTSSTSTSLPAVTSSTSTSLPAVISSTQSSVPTPARCYSFGCNGTVAECFRSQRNLTTCEKGDGFCKLAVREKKNGTAVIAAECVVVSCYYSQWSSEMTGNKDTLNCCNSNLCNGPDLLANGSAGPCNAFCLVLFIAFWAHLLGKLVKA